MKIQLLDKADTPNVVLERSVGSEVFKAGACLWNNVVYVYSHADGIHTAVFKEQSHIWIDEPPKSPPASDFMTMVKEFEKAHPNMSWLMRTVRLDDIIKRRCHKQMKYFIHIFPRNISIMRLGYGEAASWGSTLESAWAEAHAKALDVYADFLNEPPFYHEDRFPRILTGESLHHMPEGTYDIKLVKRDGKLYAELADDALDVRKP